MIFWAVIAAGVISIGFMIRYGLKNRHPDELIAVLWILMSVVPPMLIITLLNHHLAGTAATRYDDQEQELRALGTSHGMEGERTFLGSGIVGGAASFSYITSADDGSFTLESVPATDSKVWEDSSARPRIVERHGWVDAPWALPYEVDAGITYEFHVPAGSVAETFDVKP